MIVSIEKVKTEDKQTLTDLIKTYQKELGNTENPEEYKYLNSYWTDSKRYPLFINVDGIIAGFALINSYTVLEKNAKSIAEFFIESKYRKKGVGKEAAKQVFDRIGGKWEIRELFNNTAGQNFWRSIISNYTNGNFREEFLDNKKWHGYVQIFEKHPPLI